MQTLLDALVKGPRIIHREGLRLRAQVLLRYAMNAHQEDHALAV